MEFMMVLPQTFSGNDNILVFIDLATKLDYFLLLGLPTVLSN